MTPVALRGPALAVATCARRLGPLGARPRSEHAGHPEALVLDWDDAAAGTPLDVDLSWYGPARVGDRRGSEAAVQAMSGLMAVHGRDRGGPRRVGLEVASVTAGILAGQALLAAAIGRGRGLRISAVQTSVLEAALLLVSHRAAADTSGIDWVPAPPGPAPGPPFRSGDGEWFEIETLDALAWKAFWERLGAGDADLDLAWRLFRPRYFRGTCTLPAGLHEATASLPLRDITAAAQACAVSLRRVRGYDEVVADFDLSAAHPVARAVTGQGRARPGGEVPPCDGALPLSGLRVVEATSRMQGPLASRLLQLLGAHVIRVEPPGGDLFRTVPPLLGDTGSFFLTFNRGKEPVELDLSTPAGRGALRDLVAGADVFLHNWRPGKAAEWDLEAHDLTGVNPRLVYAQASGWGDRPDLAHIVGTDFLVQAHAGVAAGLNPTEEDPLPSRALFADYAGALVTCEAALIGLLAAQRTGRAQQVDASLLGGALALQAHVLEALIAGREEGRRDGRPAWGPLDHPLPTADGLLAITVEDPEDLRRVAAVCGVKAREGVDAVLAERIGGAPSGRWQEDLTAAGIACAEVCTDLGALPAQPEIADLFEPLAAAASVPCSPWRLRR